MSTSEAFQKYLKLSDESKGANAGAAAPPAFEEEDVSFSCEVREDIAATSVPYKSIYTLFSSKQRRIRGTLSVGGYALTFKTSWAHQALGEAVARAVAAHGAGSPAAAAAEKAAREAQEHAGLPEPGEEAFIPLKYISGLRVARGDEMNRWRSRSDDCDTKVADERENATLCVSVGGDNRGGFGTHEFTAFDSPEELDALAKLLEERAPQCKVRGY